MLELRVAALAASATPPPRRRRAGLIGVAALAIAGVTGAAVVLHDGESAEAGYSLSTAAAAAAEAHTVAMHMTIEMSQLGTIEGDVALDTDSGLMQAEMNLDGEQAHMVLDMHTGTAYVKAPDMGLADDLWVSYDMGPATRLPAGPTPMGDQPWTNPLDISQLIDGDTPIEDLGITEVDGVSLKHYRATLDTSAMSDAFEAGGSAYDVPDELVYDLYVDADGVLREMDFEMSLLGQTARYRITIDSIGAPIDIQIPDPDHVVPMGDPSGA